MGDASDDWRQVRGASVGAAVIEVVAVVTVPWVAEAPR